MKDYLIHKGIGFLFIKKKKKKFHTVPASCIIVECTILITCVGRCLTLVKFYISISGILGGIGVREQTCSL